jgi:mannan endo-1,6-alpha-mannosidase
MYEVACEGVKTCNVDQRSFKAYLSRWMAATTQMASWTFNDVSIRLNASAMAAAKTCSAGPNQTSCGLVWTTGQNDGSLGVGEQLNALEVIQSTLISQVAPPTTGNTGGTSIGDPSAGSGGDKPPTGASALRTMTEGDKAGAGILTFLILVTMLGGSWWLAT